MLIGFFWLDGLVQSYFYRLTEVENDQAKFAISFAHTGN